MEIKTIIHITSSKDSTRLITKTIEPEINKKEIKIKGGKEIIIEIKAEKVSEARAKYNTITRLIKVAEDISNAF